MGTVCIEIPREIVNSARTTVPDIKRELALLLYQQKKISFGKARELAEMNVWAFQSLLGTRGVPAHYDLEDFADDMCNLKALDQ